MIISSSALLANSNFLDKILVPTRIRTGGVKNFLKILPYSHINLWAHHISRILPQKTKERLNVKTKISSSLARKPTAQNHCRQGPEKESKKILVYDAPAFFMEE